MTARPARAHDVVDESQRALLGNEKILVTGATGAIGFPMARALAKDNEVWALARFSAPQQRDELQSLGIRCVQKDLAQEFLNDVPDDLGYVLHAGASLSMRQEDAIEAFETNVQGTGRLMAHCRSVSGFVYCSSAYVYEYQGNSHELTETDPLGVFAPGYSLTKIAAEAVVEFASRHFGIPTTIIRIASFYGPTGRGPRWYLDMLASGEEIPLHPDAPSNYRPLHWTDAVRLGIKAMTVGQVPPIVVNWTGDEVVSAEGYLAYLGELIGRTPRFVYTDGVEPPLLCDVARMHELLGTCRVAWRDGLRDLAQQRYPELVRATHAQPQP